MESKKDFRRNVQSGINIGVVMELKILKAEDNLTSSWSGGTTAQISIYPESSAYEKRDFIWRISSATVEAEESDFTQLTDFDRILMVLEGEVVLSHEAERVSRLSQYQQDRFEGACHTKSFGKIKDFNVMYRKKSDAYLETIDLANQISKLEVENHLENKADFESQFFFCTGEFSIIVVNGLEYFLGNGDTLVITRTIQEEIDIGKMGSGKVIHGIIQFDQEKTEEIASIPREKASLDDLKMAAYLCFTNFRGSQYIFKGRKNTWHDKELQKSISKIESLLLPFIIGLVGLILVAVWTKEAVGESAMLAAVAIWLVFDIFILNPLMYFMVLPKPIRAHIKNIEDLSEFEKRIYEEDKSGNKRAEKILKKYKITGRNKYSD
ncbi:MAG: HutD family protein [Peptostreptococcaceae bacterium]|nr:HutD family protein [Peptostreptococcaceae bacterium]